MPDIKLLPINKTPHATLDLPGSKSIANRVLPLAAISSGVSIIHNVPDSEDVSLMLEALQELGIKVEEVDTRSDCYSNSVRVDEKIAHEKTNAYHSNLEYDSKITQKYKSYKIHGCNGVFPNKNAQIFCGNSGTTIRFLSAILSIMPGTYILDGIERMRERPIKDLVTALRQIGANISYLHQEGYPPIQIMPIEEIDSCLHSNDKDASSNEEHGSNDENVRDICKKNVKNDSNNAEIYNAASNNQRCSKISISGSVSSQYLTGILLATTVLKHSINIEVIDELISKPYVDITINLIKKFGVNINKLNDNNYQVDMSDSKNKLSAIEYTVEPDASSASYFLALGAISGEITVNNLSAHSLQGDKNFAQVLHLMGADTLYADNSITVKPGHKMQESKKLTAIDTNMEDMPDVAMTIAVLALFADGVTTITGIHSWKVKETDRLLAMHNELRKLGADVCITDHSIKITPPAAIKSDVEIDTYNDHRMAMCFSLVAAYGVAITIKNYECVNKTFPTYFELFKTLCYK